MWKIECWIIKKAFKKNLLTDEYNIFSFSHIFLTSCYVWIEAYKMYLYT